MRISVVIPVLNEEKRLPECLKALNNNREKPYEIIVADGGSTDSTKEIASAYGCVVLDNPKGHAAGGRNVGINSAWPNRCAVFRCRYAVFLLAFFSV